MKIEWTKRHWVVCAILLAMQVFGIVVSCWRGTKVDAAPGWLDFGLFAVRNEMVAVAMIIPYVLGACMAATIVMISLWEAVAPHR